MADVVVPRWEWRTFGDRLDTAERVLRELETERVEESDEFYVLSAHNDTSTKLRGGLMDMKRLEQVSPEGLQLWRPVMKAEFPLSGAEVRSLFTGLDVPVPDLAHAEYPLDELRDLVAATPDLRVVGVHKHRARYRVDDCMVESTEFRADGHVVHTIAIESPDPVLVLATIDKLGLGGRRNVNVAHGLKALVGFGARRYAAIDVGTNSVKYHLGERQSDGSWRTVADRAEITRLGEGLDQSGRLAPEAVERTAAAIVAMVEDAQRNDAVAIAAVGTAGLRAAPNRETLVDAVRARCGVTVEVISGEEEARLAYLAATSTLPVGHRRLVVFDSGGGSSQFTFGRPDAIEEQFSVDVGAVRIAERHRLSSAVSEDALHAALDAIAADLERLSGRSRPDAIIGMGGTVTNLAAVNHGLREYDADVVHGTVLDLAELDRQIELYRARDAEGRREIAGLQPQRAEVILAGACIVRTILTRLGHTSLTVCDQGLRHGLLVERFAGAEPGAPGPGAEAPGPS